MVFSPWVISSDEWKLITHVYITIVYICCIYNRYIQICYIFGYENMGNFELLNVAEHESYDISEVTNSVSARHSMAYWPNCTADNSQLWEAELISLSTVTFGSRANTCRASFSISAHYCLAYCRLSTWTNLWPASLGYLCTAHCYGYVSMLVPNRNAVGFFLLHACSISLGRGTDFQKPEPDLIQPWQVRLICPGWTSL